MNETVVTFSIPNLVTITIMTVIGGLVLHLVTARVRKAAAAASA
jgi:hypothetical protein